MNEVEVISREDLLELSKHPNGKPFHGSAKCRARLQANELLTTIDGGNSWRITSEGLIALAEVGLK